MVKICAAKTQNSDFKSAQKSLVWPWAIFTVFHCFSGYCFWHMFYDPENGHFGDQFGPIKCHFLRSWVHTHNVWYGMYILMDQGPIAHDSILILIPFAPLCGVPHDPILGDPGSSFWTSEIWPKNGQKPCSKNTKQCFQKCSKVLSLALRRFRTCVCFYMILDPKIGHFGGKNGRFWSILDTHGTHFTTWRDAHIGVTWTGSVTNIPYAVRLGCHNVTPHDTTWWDVRGPENHWKTMFFHCFFMVLTRFFMFFRFWKTRKRKFSEKVLNCNGALLNTFAHTKTGFLHP